MKDSWLAKTSGASTLLLFSLCGPALEATAEPTSTPATYSFPKDRDHLLLEAREIVGWKPSGPQPNHHSPSPKSTEPPYRGHVHRIEAPQWRHWRLFGDGRLEISSPLSVPSDLVLSLDPEMVTQLLQLLDRQLDLTSLRTDEPPPPYDPFLAVHLSLDHALAVDPPAASFRELSAIRQWLIRRDHPELVENLPPSATCQPSTPWCDDLLRLGVFDPEAEAEERKNRDALLERLRDAEGTTP